MRFRAPVGHTLSHFPHFLQPITVINPVSGIHKLFKLTGIDRFWTKCAKAITPVFHDQTRDPYAKINT